MKPFFYLFACILFAACSNSSEKKPDATVAESDEPKYIPELTAVDVYGNLENKGFTVKKDFGASEMKVTCDLVDGEHVYTGRVLGKGPEAITKVDATAAFPKATNTDREFIGYMASTPYKGAAPKEATAWAVDHFDNGGDTTIGTVRFVITAASPTARVLSLYAH